MVDRTLELSTDHPGRLLRRYSLPAIIGMTVTSTYNLVDALFVGQGAGTTALAALAVAFPVQMLFMAISQTIGMGAASFISRALGAGRKREAEAAAGTAFTLVISLSLVFTVVGLLAIDPLLRLFGATNDTLPLGRQYLEIVLPAAVFFCFSVSANSIIRSEGNQNTAMNTLLVGGIINLILDPILIFGFDMGIRGAAIATFVGQLGSFIHQVIYFRSGKSLLRIGLADLRPDRKLVREILSVGSAALGRNIASSVFSIVVNKSISIYGTEVHLAILGITFRVMMLMLMPLFGLVQAMQPIVGYNFGASNTSRVISTLKIGILWSTAWSFFCFIVFQVFAEYIMASFDNNPVVHSEGGDIFRIILLLTPLIGFQVVASSFFQHIGRARPAVFLSMTRQLLFLIPLLILLPLFVGLPGIWLAFPISDGMAFFVTAAWLAVTVRRLKAAVHPA